VVLQNETRCFLFDGGVFIEDGVGKGESETVANAAIERSLDALVLGSVRRLSEQRFLAFIPFFNTDTL